VCHGVDCHVNAVQADESGSVLNQRLRRSETNDLRPQQSPVCSDGQTERSDRAFRARLTELRAADGDSEVGYHEDSLTWSACSEVIENQRVDRSREFINWCWSRRGAFNLNQNIEARKNH